MEMLKAAEVCLRRCPAEILSPRDALQGAGDWRGASKVVAKAVTGGCQSGYWWLPKRLLVVAKAVTGGCQSGYWWFQKRLLVVVKAVTGGCKSGWGTTSGGRKQAVGRSGADTSGGGEPTSHPEGQEEAWGHPLTIRGCFGVSFVYLSEVPPPPHHCKQDCGSIEIDEEYPGDLQAPANHCSSPPARRITKDTRAPGTAQRCSLRPNRGSTR